MITIVLVIVFVKGYQYWNKPKKVLAVPHITPEMIFIPGGTFEMGSDKKESETKPVHTVELSSFYMGKYEVTNKEYCDFLNYAGNETEGKTYNGHSVNDWIKLNFGPPLYTNESSGIIESDKPETFTVKPGHEKRPVSYVTWYGAIAYCNWLSECEGLEKCYNEKNITGTERLKNFDITKNGYRLPTDAEWEYACRAGSITDYYWGENYNYDTKSALNIDNYCWCRHPVPGDDSYKKVNKQDVGLLNPNNFGLFDMSGNVKEWCNDWYGKYSADYIKNPLGPNTGKQIVMRGGSYDCGAFSSQSHVRIWMDPSYPGNDIGFRLVKSVSSENVTK